MNKWDQYFFDIASRTAGLSKDRRTKVGAVIVGTNREILSVGYNGFPMKIDDDLDERHEAPRKYFFTEHAERNAIYHGARRGISLVGTTMYTTLFPCADCARGIIQVGIKAVFYPMIDITKDSPWRDSFVAANAMMREAKIKLDGFWVDGGGRP